MKATAADAWTPDAAEHLARGCGIAKLSEQHWRVLAVCRELAAHDGRCPLVEQVAVSTGLTIPQLATLFGGRAAELIPVIAGIERSIR